MDNSLSFNVFKKSFKSNSFYGHKACYGDYVKTRLFREEFHDHIVTVYIWGNVFSRNNENKKIIFTPNNLIVNSRATIEDSELYLNHFNGRYFEYEIKKHVEPFNKLYQKIYGGNDDVFKAYEGYDTPTEYLTVTIDLSQFKQSIHAKNALFFIRNSVYTCNAVMLKTFKIFKKYIKNTDFNFFHVLQFGGLLHLIEKDNGNSEYSFFARGYAGNNGLDKLKYLTPIPEEKYWDLLKSSSQENIDDVMNSRYTNYPITRDLLKKLRMLVFRINAILICENHEGKIELTEREEKLFIKSYKNFLNQYKK